MTKTWFVPSIIKTVRAMYQSLPKIWLRKGSYISRQNTIFTVCVLILITIAILINLFTGQNHGPKCSGLLVGSPVNASPDGICPRLGRMGDLILRIPRNYIAGPDFVYDGVDIWNKDSWENRPKIDSTDINIQYFVIQIRQSDFQPPKTNQDMDDIFQNSISQEKFKDPSKQWISVTFRQPTFNNEINKIIDPSDVFNYIIDKHHGYDFISLDPERGLEHYISQDPPSTNTVSSQINEIYYNRSERASIIECSNFRRRLPPYDIMTSCKHVFNTPDNKVNIMISDIYVPKMYLENWKQTEDKVLEILNSFVVRTGK